MSLPPYAETLGLIIDRSGPSGMEVVMPYGEQVLGRPGFLHGGAIAGLMEIAGLTALFDALGSDRPRVKPINISIDFMRGGRMIETRAAGRVTRIGSRIANVEAFAWQEDREKPIAAARINLMLSRDEGV